MEDGFRKLNVKISGVQGERKRTIWRESSNIF